jgi:branched-chain amino acid transport system substrate-binding protein
MPVKTYAILATCMLLLAGCKADYESMAAQRAVYAKNNQGTVVIVAIDDLRNDGYIQGISLAVEEINQKNGGLLGRPVKLLVEPGHNDFETAKPVIRQIAKNPRVSLVLGHRADEVVLPASVVYEQSHLLFFPPFTTSNELRSRGSVFTFGLLPDNIHMAEHISAMAESLGYKNITVLHAHADKYREFSLLFEQAAINRGLNIALSQSLSGQNENYRLFISDLKKKSFDAVFVAAKDNTAARLVRQMREMGLNQPILGSADLRSDEFKTSVGIAGNHTIVPTPYNVLSSDPMNQRFVKAYRDKFGQPPNAEAAQGYDSVMLFANKAERAQSTVPVALATSVRFSQPWAGVTGPFHFDKHGAVEDKRYFFQELKDEQWQPLAVAD